MRLLHVIGDSQVLTFRDRVFSSAAGRLVVCRTAYVRGLLAKDFSAPDGSLHPAVFGELVREGFLYPTNGTWQTMPTTSTLRRSTPTGARAQGRRPLLFFCGGLDAVVFVRQHRNRLEIDLPSGYPALAGRGVDERISFESAYAAIERYLFPLERGLRTLKALGFEQIYVHSASPNEAPPSGIELRRTVKRYDIDLRSFQQAILVLNTCLRDMAARLGIGYIDTMPDVLAENGYRDPRYTRDLFHMNAVSATFTIDALEAAGAL